MNEEELNKLFQTYNMDNELKNYLDSINLNQDFNSSENDSSKKVDSNLTISMDYDDILKKNIIENEKKRKPSEISFSKKNSKNNLNKRKSSGMIKDKKNVIDPEEEFYNNILQNFKN